MTEPDTAHINPLLFLTEELEREDLVRQVEHLRRCEICAGRVRMSALLQQCVELRWLTRPRGRARSRLWTGVAAAALWVVALVGLAVWRLDRQPSLEDLATSEAYPIVQTAWRGRPDTLQVEAEALDLYQRGLYRQVVADLDNAGGILPPQLRLVRAISLYLSGDLKRADAELETVVAGPDQPLAEIALWYRAHCALRQNDAGAALSRLKTLARSSPTFRARARELIEEIEGG